MNSLQLMSHQQMLDQLVDISRQAGVIQKINHDEDIDVLASQIRTAAKEVAAHLLVQVQKALTTPVPPTGSPEPQQPAGGSGTQNT